ncbi:hypothetical protein [Sphingobium sp. RAC03]|uniref:hypothetical protein n=1 Tax=Sphingobium sp. RAC03 TaxID=1843368 RepID=UPI001F329854|nr:hypothetical protein [Sphingobium sp. RAC03]
MTYFLRTAKSTRAGMARVPGFSVVRESRDELLTADPVAVVETGSLGFFRDGAEVDQLGSNMCFAIHNSLHSEISCTIAARLILR